jgi:hypothetical protein
MRSPAALRPAVDTLGSFFSPADWLDVYAPDGGDVVVLVVRHFQ